MLSYLFLLAAAVASPELSMPDAENKELRELINIFEQEASELASETNQKTTSKISTMQTAPITITNAIEPGMLAYKHWTGTYSPDIFAVSINGTDVSQGTTYELPAQSTTVEIGYTYSFANGIKTGGKKIEYQLHKNITQAHITFSWKDDWRIIVDNATAIKEISS